MKVLFLTNVPSPYRVDFFNELGKCCELTVGFEKNTSDERDSSWQKYKFVHFEGVILKGRSIRTDAAICPGVVALINRCHYDEIIVCNISSPTGILAIEYMKLRSIPYWIEGDGGFAKFGKGMKERIKKHLLTGAKGYFSTSKAHDEYYISYGADPKKIHRYPFASMSEKDLVDAYSLYLQDRKRLREALGMEEESIILSVGRFSYLNGYGKGYDVLLRAASSMGSEYGWYIIGGEPTEEFKRLTKEAGVSNFHYVKHIGKQELEKYYRAADVFVLMTVSDVWGLVINEAMACGLPVITTDKCGAGLELVENGVNGYIVPVGDEKELQKAINKVFENNADGHMNEASIERIKPYTIENMAKIHMRVFAENTKNG